MYSTVQFFESHEIKIPLHVILEAGALKGLSDQIISAWEEGPLACSFNFDLQFF